MFRVARANRVSQEEEDEEQQRQQVVVVACIEGSLCVSDMCSARLVEPKRAAPAGRAV